MLDISDRARLHPGSSFALLVFWDFASQKTPGISGFDFRLYGGLRFLATKPSYFGAVKDLNKQLRDSGATRRGNLSPKTNTIGGVSDRGNPGSTTESKLAPAADQQVAKPTGGS